MKNIFILLLSIFVIVIAGYNKDEPVACDDETNSECPNYDPCHDQEATSADFKTAVVLADTKYEFVTAEEDTFYFGSKVLFTAKEENALSYQWTIGDDDRVFTEQEFSLRFELSDSLSLSNRPIPIQLIITRTPNTDCFPSDDGIDTIIKNIYFVSFHEVEHRNFIGTWIGSREDKPDEMYEIEIYDEPRLFSPAGVPAGYALIFKNIDNEGNRSCLFITGSAARYNAFYVPDMGLPDEDCQYSAPLTPDDLFGVIDKRGNLRIEWDRWEGSDTGRIKYAFNGRRM